GDLAGRPLYAANAALPWPDAPHLVLWSAATRLREHRGDGHVAALLAAPLDPCEANVALTATGSAPDGMQREYRWWSEADWQAAVARLQQRGWLDAAGTFTAAGRAAREAVEQRTDALALGPWEHLGAAQSQRLWTLLRDISERL